MVDTYTRLSYARYTKQKPSQKIDVNGPYCFHNEVKTLIQRNTKSR